jgi:ribosomal protein S18 acetylase RimI-like enzyme
VAVTYKNLEDHLELLDVFMDHMESTWEARGGGPGLKASMKKKVLDEIGKKISGEILLHENEPKALYWLEITTPFYGNITLHALDETFAEGLALRAIEKGCFDNKQIEIVQVVETSVYRDVFREYDLTENKRERMALWLEEELFFQEEPTDFDLDYFLMTDEYIETMATMSYEAHQISRDYWMYPEMNDLQGRIGLEKKVFSGQFGDLVPEANLMVFHNGQPIGYIVYVGVPCWGFKKVPWVFDIVVKPGYDGKGIGRELMKRSLNILTEMKFPIVGLSVTQDNYAKKLYDYLGFQPVDEFYEFINLNLDR